MLISHKFKFIFIKTVKTAGTSIEIELSKLMAAEDIVTPVNPAVDGHCPRNHADFRNHIPAADIRGRVGAEIFDRYFKFCVEREPVDKCISHFSMLKHRLHRKSETADLGWEEYVQNGNFPLDTARYTDRNGTLLVDKIVRYESLAAEMRAIGEALGFALGSIDAKAKSGFRQKISASKAQRELIYAAFASSNRFTHYRI